MKFVESYIIVKGSLQIPLAASIFPTSFCSIPSRVRLRINKNHHNSREPITPKSASSPYTHHLMPRKLHWIVSTYAAVAVKISTLVAVVIAISADEKASVNAPMRSSLSRISFMIYKIAIATVGKRHAMSVVILAVNLTHLPKEYSTSGWPSMCLLPNILWYKGMQWRTMMLVKGS